jgi:CubicO group peptidase (beta-lactamase class C family)
MVDNRTVSFDAVVRLLGDAVGDVFPAAQLVVADAGEIVFERAVGAATLDTVFDLASLTKPLCTTTLAMRDVERGLALDEPVRPGVTVRHLLSHSSGLPAWKLLSGGGKAAILEAVRREPLERAPGSAARYSDLGFILLGGFLEGRAGRPLDARFDEEIAGPLGLAMTYHPEPLACAPTEGELRGVVHDENARAMGGIAGHAGLFSTAREVSRVAAELCAAFGGLPGRLVAPDTARIFFTPSGVPGSTWCLGWDRPSPTGSSAGTSWPRSGVGHLGFTGCSLWMDPPRGRWVILLSNRVYPTRANERIKAFRPVLHDAVWDALG